MPILLHFLLVCYGKMPYICTKIKQINNKTITKNKYKEKMIMESRKFDPSVLSKKPFRGIISEIAKEEQAYRSNIWYRVNTSKCKKTLAKVAAKMQERIELEERLSKLSAYGK